MTRHRCAVLGDPIEHSLSPTLHRAGYAALGLDFDYTAVRVDRAGLAEFVAGRDATWRGLSLTMPLKRDVLDLAGAVTDRARQAGVANTLVLDDDGTQADNTDWPGAVAALRERYAGPVADVVVLGAGATATSVALGLCDLGAARVRLLARSADRAAPSVEAIRRHPGRPEVTVGPLPGDPAEPLAADVLVSTVPVAAQTDELVGGCAAVPVVFEVLYDPWPTPLAAAALRDGRVLVSGLDLLVHQAALQFEQFTGVAVDPAVLRSAGQAELAARGTRR